MSTELIINASLPETRIALMEDGEIQELLIERASDKGIVGNIYKGRVTRVLPGMQAAFVDIGLEKAAFLYVDDVFVHSEVWEEEEELANDIAPVATSPAGDTAEGAAPIIATAGGAEAQEAQVDGTAPMDAVPALDGAQVAARISDQISDENTTQFPKEQSSPAAGPDDDYELDESDVSSNLLAEEEDEEEDDDLDEEDDEEDDDLEDDFEDEDEDGDEEDEDEEDEDDDDRGPVRMGPGPDDEDGRSGDAPVPGTISPSQDSSTSESHSVSAGDSEESQSESSEVEAGSEVGSEENFEAGTESGPISEEEAARRRRRRRGRRGGRNRRGREEGEAAAGGTPAVSGGRGVIKPRTESEAGEVPANFQAQMTEEAEGASDRATMVAGIETEGAQSGRPGSDGGPVLGERGVQVKGKKREEFKEPRDRGRRISSKSSMRPPRGQVNIQDLLKEGQEVLVQVAKDPIATKGARLTCHISLPGRHLVCMPTIDHVGVSRRIDRDDERRKLRDLVEKNRPKKLGFIVRTASGKGQSERRVKQDIDYLSRLWTEIREKAATTTAPALVYEDLNSVLRAIRDWVTEEIDKIVVDSRYHFNEMQKFVSHFMPALKQKVDLYHGDIPIFDAYNISSELARSLERKVWLKSGGYLVIDQAEALVAIDVNTGRYVGKKNLEDTILKTNLEAVQEVAYQLRLRNCGGIIIIDLIDMEKEENKQRVYRALEDALKKDRARPNILKISELGLVEMTRKRTRDTMIRALCESCDHCEGKGYIKSKQTVAYEIMREIEREGIERDVTKILVQAHPDTIDILAIEERETLDQLERRYRKQFYLQAIGDFHREQFEVSAERLDRGDRPAREQERGRGRDRGGDRGRGRDRGRSSGSSDRDSNKDKDRNREDQVAQGRDSAVALGDSSRDSGRDSGSSRDSGEEGGKRRRRGRRGRGRDREPVVRSQPIQAHTGPTGGYSDQEPANESGGYTEDSAGAFATAHEQSSQPIPQNQRDSGAKPQEFGDEEDRLAFLRAQAAQDAALASLQAQGVASPSANIARGPGAGRGPGGAGGGQNRDRNDRGDRGGERGGRGRNRRGPKRGPGGPGSGPVQAGAPNPVSSGPPRIIPVANRPDATSAPAAPSAAPTRSTSPDGGEGSQMGNGGSGLSGGSGQESPGSDSGSNE